MSTKKIQRILLSNDDGLMAPGLQTLYWALKNHGYDVMAVAPDSEQSTSGHSLTLHKPLYALKPEENQVAITGTPVDCVYVATAEFFKHNPPDLVISGINRGANLGNDVYYSGTVAAAREGFLLNHPAIAVSLMVTQDKDAGEFDQTYHHYDTAADVIIELLETHVPKVLEKDSRFLWNVNVPDIEKEAIKGIKPCALGHRLYSNELLKRTDPRHRTYFWIAGHLLGHKDTFESDCVAVENGYVSLTPLQIDCANHESIAHLKTLID